MLPLMFGVYKWEKVGTVFQRTIATKSLQKQRPLREDGTHLKVSTSQLYTSQNKMAES